MVQIPHPLPPLPGERGAEERRRGEGLNALNKQNQVAVRHLSRFGGIERQIQRDLNSSE